MTFFDINTKTTLKEQENLHNDLCAIFFLYRKWVNSTDQNIVKLGKEINMLQGKKAKAGNV